MSNNPPSSSSSSHPDRTSHIGGAPLGRPSPPTGPVSVGDLPPSPPTSTTRRTSASVRLPPFRTLNAWHTHQLQLDFMPPPSSLYQASSSTQSAAGSSAASTLQRLPRVVRRPRPSQPPSGTERVDFGSIGDGADPAEYELAGEGDDFDWQIGEFEGPGGGPGGGQSLLGDLLTSSEDDDDDDDDPIGYSGGGGTSWGSLLTAGQGEVTSRAARLSQSRIPATTRQREHERMSRQTTLRRETMGPGVGDGTGYLLGQKKGGEQLFEAAPYLSLRPPNLPSPRLPTHFSPSDHSELLSISPSGFTVSFMPRTSRDGEQDAASVRANLPIDPTSGLFYYEVEIISAGERGYIGIGFCARTVRLNRLPGWEKDSYGYHGDDGLSFASQGEGKPFSQPFTTGDIIGCGLDFATGAAFYTKNGVPTGPVWPGMRTHEMYPTVGLRTPREVVKANFGQFPFKYDIASYFRSRQLSYLLPCRPTFPSSSPSPGLQLTPTAKGKGKVVQRDEDEVDLRQVVHLQAYLRQARLNSQVEHQLSLDPDASAVVARRQSEARLDAEDAPRTGTLDELVKDYLLHQGFASTFDKLRQDQRTILGRAPKSLPPTGSDGHAMDVDLARDVGATGDEGSLSPLRKLTSEAREGSVERKWIRRLVCEGKTESALSQLEAYPTVKTGQVGFELQCCHLVGMIIAAAAGRKEAASGGRGTDRDAVGMSLKRKGEAHDGRSSSPKTPKLGLHNDGNSSPGRQRKSQSPMDDSSLPSLPAALSFPEIDLEDRILSYGRQLRRTLEELPAPRDRMDRLFSNCMGLLAFEDPMGEGVVLGRGGEAALMLWTGRANLAEKLVDAMLQSRGEPKESELETVVRHTIATHTEMGRKGKGTASFVDVRARCLA